jgi:hypothetical protein
MKKLLFILFSLFIGTVLVLVFSELFLRVNPKFGYGNYYKSPPTQDLKTLMSRKRPAALLGYENIPNISGMNSHGLVSREYSLKKGSKTYRILILGDSVGEGMDTGFLEDLLNQNSILHPKYSFEIWNGSVGGYDIRQYDLYLKHKGLEFRPDMVIIFFCLNDFDIDTSVYYKDEKGTVQYSFHISSPFMSRHPPNLMLMRYSYLYRLIVLKLNSFLLGLEKQKKGISPQENQGVRYLAEIKSLCEENHLPLFTVIFPYLKPINEYDDMEIRQYAGILSAIKQLNIDDLDLHDFIPQQALYGLRFVQEDQIHTKGEKSHLLMKTIYDYLSNKLINIPVHM